MLSWLGMKGEAIGGAVEDLHIKGMVGNHKLAQAISGASWGQFLTMLDYKGKPYGCLVRKLDGFFPSSKRCPKSLLQDKDTKRVTPWAWEAAREESPQ